MAYQFLQIEKDGGILKVTMHDPGTRNALGEEMARELMDELDRFEDDPEDRLLLLTGTEPSFCSGANVKRFQNDIQGRESEVADESPPTPSGKPWAQLEARLGDMSKISRSLASTVPLRIFELQKPSIAAVNGHAMGVGMGLALSCDMRIASEKAVFSEAFVRMGIVPGDGSCWQLPRLIGLSNTFLLQYTGDKVDGTEAYRMGLVNKVVPPEELMPAAMELASRLAQGPTQSLSLIKYMVHKSMEMNLKDSLGMARIALGLCHETKDHKEAVQAFLEKRPPKFIGA